LRLNFTRRESTPCGEEVVLPEFGKRAHLPEGRTIAIEVTPEHPGEYEFTCGMNMYKGKLIVE
jgi:plastocyanin domain-containing protein